MHFVDSGIYQGFEYQIAYRGEICTIHYILNAAHKNMSHTRFCRAEICRRIFIQATTLYMRVPCKAGRNLLGLLGAVEPLTSPRNLLCSPHRVLVRMLQHSTCSCQGWLDRYSRTITKGP
eukprot:756088-Amphidinium_carterae.1